MTALFVILTAIIGLSMPVQTAVNSRQERFLGSSLVSTLVCFIVGTVLVLILAAFSIGSFSAGGLSTIPWHAWTGGVSGMLCVWLFIIVFPRLGGIQTVLLPMLGQIATSMLIDTFGLFGMERTPLSATRLIGALVVVAGVLLAVLKKDEGQGKKGLELLPWQLLGIIAGALIAAQSAANGALGVHLGSPILASAVSFTVSTVLLVAMVAFSPTDRAALGNVFTVKRPWWTWMGGVIGVLIVAGFAASAPVLGVGLMSVVSILGQLAMSVLIDKFGLFGSEKRKVTTLKYIGILTVLAGAVIVHL